MATHKIELNSNTFQLALDKGRKFTETHNNGDEFDVSAARIRKVMDGGYLRASHAEVKDSKNGSKWKIKDASYVFEFESDPLAALDVVAG